jgi:hypothetical protein
MTSLASTKSQVAKLMATENITVEHRNTPTAMFDVKNRVLTLPNLKDGLSVNLYDLMTSHEVGHALFTPEEGWHDAVIEKGAIFKGYLNVVEDARIEKKIKAKYPGLLKAYREGYKELLDRNFFGIAGKDIANMAFIDRINLHFKLGTLVNLKFEGEEAVWVEKIAALNTWDEVFALTTELYASEIEKAEQQLEEQLEQMLADASDDSEENDETETDGSGASGGFGDTETEENSDDYGDEYFDDDMGDLEGEPMSAEEMIQSETDEAYRENEGTLTAASRRDTNYYKFGDLNIADKIVVPFSETNVRYAEMFRENPNVLKEVQEKWKIWRSQNTKVVNYMVKEFEMRKKADEFKRTSVAKTGELDMNRVFQYKFNDDLFKKVATVRGGKNHGFVMLLDWSGSMADNMSATIDQLLNMVMFCKKVNLPFEVYAFTDHFGASRRDDDWNNTPVKTLVPSTGVKLVTLFNSKMKTNEFNNACLGLMSVRENLSNGNYYRFCPPRGLELGGTPLDDALVVMPEVIAKFRKNHNVQIMNFVVMTDGESNSASCVETDYACTDNKISTGFYASSSADNYLTDTVTKKTYAISSARRGNALTSAILEAIGDRCDVNTIGFFIMSDKARDIKHQASRFGIYDFDVVRNIRSNKFLEVKSAGYDSYFLIPGGKSLETAPEGIDADAGASKSKLKTAFMKASNAKTANRVLLNRVMEIVS